MKPNKSLHPRARLGSFTYAIRGIRHLVRREPNAKLHFAATIITITAGFLRHITMTEWIAIIIAIALVWIAEALNTAIELLCDLWCNGEYHPVVGTIKDLAAGAVLIASLASLTIGVIVFFF